MEAMPITILATDRALAAFFRAKSLMCSPATWSLRNSLSVHWKRPGTKFQNIYILWCSFHFSDTNESVAEAAAVKLQVQTQLTLNERRQSEFPEFLSPVNICQACSFILTSGKMTDGTLVDGGLGFRYGSGTNTNIIVIIIWSILWVCLIFAEWSTCWLGIFWTRCERNHSSRPSFWCQNQLIHILFIWVRDTNKKPKFISTFTWIFSSRQPDILWIKSARKNPVMEGLSLSDLTMLTQNWEKSAQLAIA